MIVTARLADGHAGRESVLVVCCDGRPHWLPTSDLVLRQPSCSRCSQAGGTALLSLFSNIPQPSGIAIGCARRAVHTVLLLCGAQTNPVCGREVPFGILDHRPAPSLLLQYPNFCRSMQTYASTKQYLCLVHTWTFYLITDLKTLHFIVVRSLDSETFEASLFAEISAEKSCAPEKYLQFVSCGRVYAGVWWLFVNVWGHKLGDFFAFRLFCPKIIHELWRRAVTVDLCLEMLAVGSLTMSVFFVDVCRCWTC